MTQAGTECFSVRVILRYPLRSTFEERITLWRAESEDVAIDLALAEADEYAADLGMESLGLAQSYRLADDPAEPGAEVFSLFRDSDLSSGEYLARFFDTGKERQRRG